MEYIGSLVYDKVVLGEDIRIVIYGNGMIGRKLYDILNNNGRLDKIECICDGNPELWGKTYQGIPIVSPKEAVSQKKDCHFLTAGRYAEEQVMFLQKNGIKNIHMFLEL